MKKYINICNIYILLWCIYYLQGVAYAVGSIISQTILLLLIVTSGYYFVKVNTEDTLPMFIKVLNIFIIMMTIYGVILILDPAPLFKGFYSGNTTGKIDFLKSIYISLLPIYPIYSFAKQGILKPEVIRILSLMLIVSTTLMYFREEQKALLEAMETGSPREEFTNNIAYDFLALFPLIFFWHKRPLIQYALMFYVLTFLIMGMKRGAIIIGLICFAWFLFRTYQTASKRNRLFIVILTLLIVIVGGYFIIDFYNNSEYFQLRIEQTLSGDSSGRDSILSHLWKYFIRQDSILNMLLGNGAFYTVTVAGNFAHNDWMEILICQGLLGVAIYALYFATLFKAFQQSKTNPHIYNVLGMCLAIMLLSSLFSMSYSSLSLGLTLSIGYCIALTPSKTDL